MEFARTLTEGRLYISITAAAGDLDDAPAGNGRTSLTEGPDAWLLSFTPEHGRGEPIDVLVRYATEDEARRQGQRFGAGVSELIDAGQWVQVSMVYARRALREGVHFAARPAGADAFASVVANWELARDAAVEAAKFVPEGQDEMPPTALWTEMGAEVRRTAPERFGRGRLEEDIAFYQQSLDDFRRMFADHAG